MRSDIIQVYDGQWLTLGQGIYRSCCDCGLTHREDYRIRKGKVQRRVYRDTKQTRNERRRVRRSWKKT